jgi:hypothetical protein
MDNREETVEETQQEIDFNLNDLIDLRILLQLFSARGAVKANEMKCVGTIFDKIDNILKVKAPNAPTLETLAREQQQKLESEDEGEGGNKPNVVTI